MKESYGGIVKTAANALTFAELGIQGQMHEGKGSRVLPCSVGDRWGCRSCRGKVSLPSGRR